MNLLHVCVIYSVEECSVIYCTSIVFSQQLLTRMNIPNWSAPIQNQILSEIYIVSR